MTKKRFTYCPFDGFEDNGKGLDSNEVLDLLNDLNDENKQLKSDKVFVELLANHRGEMISFAISLIQDMGSEEMLQIWNEFEENRFKKYLRERGLSE